ncbi:serpin family protein [Natronobiforma cellulositropha]
MLTLSGLALAGLAGCLGGGDDPSNGDDDGEPAQMRVLSADIERASPSVGDADLEALVAGNTAFALSLLEETEETNLFVSPISISLALAMTWAGAAGQTESEMADALAFPHGQEALHPAFNALWRTLEAADGDDDEEFTLRLANAIWGQDGYPFEDDFLETLARHYGAGLRTLDFGEDPEAARATINDWVAEETDDRIEDLLPEGSITDDVRLVLTNAIYFFANWESPFDEDRTEDGTFTALDGSESMVAMMHQNLRTNYAAVDGHEVLELPYAGDARMVVFLPAAGEFEDFSADLDAARFGELLEATGDAQGDLAFPRFEFETSLSLKETLSALGMETAFTDAADFSGMTDAERLFVDDVYHDAYVAVDEEGTEAAAATGAVMMPTSAPTETFDVTVDRPFLVAICDDETDSVLFLGRVGDAGAAQN